MPKHFTWTEVKAFSDAHKGKRAEFLKMDPSGKVYGRVSWVQPFGHLYISSPPTNSSFAMTPKGVTGPYGVLLVEARSDMRYSSNYRYSLTSLSELNEHTWKQENNVRDVSYDSMLAPPWFDSAIMLITSPDVMEFLPSAALKTAHHPHTCYCGWACYKGQVVECTNPACRHYKKP